MKKLADLTRDYVALRERKTEINDELKEVNGKMQDIAADFLEYFDREECSKATFNDHTVYKSESIVPSIKDWDEFWKFVLRTKAGHLVERRPSVTGCREMFQMKGKIPGLEPFNKITIGVRKA